MDGRMDGRDGMGTYATRNRGARSATVAMENCIVAADDDRDGAGEIGLTSRRFVEMVAWTFVSVEGEEDDDDEDDDGRRTMGNEVQSEQIAHLIPPKLPSTAQGLKIWPSSPAGPSISSFLPQLHLCRPPSSRSHLLAQHMSSTPLYQTTIIEPSTPVGQDRRTPSPLHTSQHVAMPKANQIGDHNTRRPRPANGYLDAAEETVKRVRGAHVAIGFVGCTQKGLERRDGKSGSGLAEETWTGLRKCSPWGDG